MEVYTVTGETPPPLLTFSGFTGAILELRTAVDHNQAVLIRAVHDGAVCASCLFGAKLMDGTMELYLFSKQGQSHDTSTNRVHHHVSELTANATAYADALGVKKFLIRSATFRKGFLKSRFEGWHEYVDDIGTVTATLEVT